MNQEKLLMKENIRKLLNKVDTPFYIYSLEWLKKNIIDIQERLTSEIELCYSIKANPILLPYVQTFVNYFEVCSLGEYRICKQIVSPDKNIIFGGVCKKKEEIREAVKDDQVILTVESMYQLNNINQISAEEQRVSKVILRLSIGNQFGIAADELLEMLKEQKSFQNIKILGIQQYAATQCFKLEEERKYIEKLFKVIEELEEAVDYQFEIVSYGGGIGIPYYEGDMGKENPKEILSGVADLLISYKKGRKIIYEAGRIIPASSGIYVSRVLDQKQTNGRTYSILDGGTNHVKYYGHTFGARKIMTELLRDESEKDVYTICGALCTVNDILLKDVEIAKHSIDDVLLFLNAGAYCQTEASALFLSRDLPAVYVVEESNEVSVIRDVINTYSINGGLPTSL